MKNIMSSKKEESGFSLVELLVVIAVIGLIAAIAIPQISKITDKAQTASDQRNAQNVVSIYGAALAAGATFTGTSATTLIDELEDGKNGSGTFADSQFKISEIDDTDVQPRVVTFMIYDSAPDPDTLTYNP